MKLNVAAMHSDLEQAQREEVMLAFKNNKVEILVATDIVARGIDIEDIGLVINYDVPRDPEDYIHRIGRTARAAATGAAVTFVNEEDQIRFYRIERFIEREVRKAALPDEVGQGPDYTPSAGRGGGRGSRKGSGEGRGRNRRDRSGRSGRSDKRRQPAAEAPEHQSAAPAAAAPEHPTAAPDGSDAQQPASAKKRRHRGGRRHRKGGKPGAQQGGTPQHGAPEAPAQE